MHGSLVPLSDDNSHTLFSLHYNREGRRENLGTRL